MAGQDQADLEDVVSPPSVVIGDVEIPLRPQGDPRFDRLDAIRRRDIRAAQEMTTEDELLRGLRHGSPIVRAEAVVRLAARFANDRRTPPALIEILAHDPVGDVRFMAAVRLQPFASDPRVRAALQSATVTRTEVFVRRPPRF